MGKLLRGLRSSRIPQSLGVVNWLKEHVRGRLFHKAGRPACKLSKPDRRALALEYPELILIDEGGKQYLRGKVKFIASYNQRQDALKIFRNHDTPSGENLIRDEYLIEIELSDDFPKSVPLVREIGGRIKQIALKHQVTDLRDLHVNEAQRDTLCLCPKPAEKEKYQRGVNVAHFLTHLVIPFLYELSFYDEHRRWPWSEYSHGDLGVFEYFAEKQSSVDRDLAQECYGSLGKQGKQIIDTPEQIKGHYLCPCGSKRPFRRCHQRALEGLWALRRVLRDKNLRNVG